MTNREFKFKVISNKKFAPSSGNYEAFLHVDNWDDWFKFSTLYILTVFDENGVEHNVGGVKIGQFGLKSDKRRPEIPDIFETLNENFFSLGQDDSYYEALNLLGDELRNIILISLKDLAADLNLFERAIKEEVTRESILRSVSPTSVRGQFHRLTQGGARLTSYRFSYQAPKIRGSDVPPVNLDFEVKIQSQPPTNIHVLIGRNGVGKTHLLNLMTQALLADESSQNKFGTFTPLSSNKETSPFSISIEETKETLFANLVSVTFSAFDPFEPLPEKRDKTDGIKYSYIGLKRSSNTGQGVGTPKSPEMFASEFLKSVRTCLIGGRGARWKSALKTLESDPIFEEAEVASLADDNDDIEFEKHATTLFRKLSSGHKIVLLTITRLVETVEERSLVLLDEPEAHLHPPLLSAFVRALSNLMINRNAVALIATHSPVVLQEVPKSCVWKLRRTGETAIAERPEIETFGENIGILTGEIFGFEVTQSGFHKLIEDSVNREPNFDWVVDSFDDQLGSEALAIARGLFAVKDSEKEDES